MSINPWISAFTVAGNVDSVFSTLERRASPVAIAGRNLEAGVESVRAGMMNVFLCDQNVRAVLLEIAGVGLGHAQVFFKSGKDVVSGTYSSNPWGSAMLPAVMLTGLAGVGKSECLGALRRLLVTRAGRVDLPGHKDVRHEPAWFMSLRDGGSLNSLLRPMLESSDVGGSDGAGPKEIKQAKLLELARRIGRRDGTCLAVIDELQFKTHSSQANAQVTGMLLNLLSLGPRLIYACNYSLGHRLKARRHEDRQRLLVQPIVLEPNTADSPCYLRLLEEYFSVVADDFDMDPVAVGDSVHRYTFGIKRAIVFLLSEAWHVAKAKRGMNAKVGPDDLKSAFLSQRYLTYREDVEALWRNSLGDIGVREDLINPFGARPSNCGNVLVASPSIQEYKRQIASAHLHDLMTPAEKAAEKALVPVSAPILARKATVIRLKADASSKAKMLDALDRLP